MRQECAPLLRLEVLGEQWYDDRFLVVEVFVDQPREMLDQRYEFRGQPNVAGLRECARRQPNAVATLINHAVRVFHTDNLGGEAWFASAQFRPDISVLGPMVVVQRRHHEVDVPADDGGTLAVIGSDPAQ